ncbi:hypothetical protein ACFSSA_10255 [Luteolibacter algae]|uniref:2TM domain-containing protein n=1 Tax=Luteolibacter algae TaxID=454151 RepID=A0ABW5DBP3_9BACT
MSGKQSDWESSKNLAKAILHDRSMRRKWLARWLILTLAWMVSGLWVIDSWLDASVVRFLIWWGICAILALGLMLFALYDALSVIREERK